ncbi:acyl-homoserine-lactone synthase [Palleronia abyssalis]|uniref:Acyl-homoserine-lactone synthase n=1 Tax=Palleronia abyssalis TaxID=1501240 RepID=A0A2R8C1H1_9RHOB|nr:acyl-homoserine-lactone synthase [Palleronia abyssalis]SPJ26258.1 Isovaleryl-homoserine lactone synthase [Palleronia abyssalis]
MIRIFEGRAIHQAPNLRDSMFRDRSAQFIDRHGWEITRDETGREIDQYDPLDPIYVIACDGDRHLGSLRLLPTTGRTMIAEHFAHLAPDGFARRGLMECTRFCIAPGAPSNVSTDLFRETFRLGLARGWDGALGIFDARMMRVYKRIGIAPKLISRDGEDRHAICLGEWTFSRQGLDRLSPRNTLPLAA